MCASPATGFDVAYFDAFSGSGRRLEAHVQCAAPFYYNLDFNGQITHLREVQVGGYHTSGSTNPDGDVSIVVNDLRHLPLPEGVEAIRPQVAGSLPCVELTRMCCGRNTDRRRRTSAGRR